MESSAIGSSRCQMTSSRSLTSSSNDSSISWWSQPKRLATRAAWRSSFWLPSSRKPIANVCTGMLDASAMSATTRLESSPPESIAPSGTSLISLMRTASASSGSSSSVYSSSVRAGSSGCGIGYRQYVPTSIRPPPIVSIPPGGSFEIAVNGVCGYGTYPRVRYASSASRSSSGSTRPEASTLLSSEAKTTTSPQCAQ